jgi:hypothetical protein
MFSENAVAQKKIHHEEYSLPRRRYKQFVHEATTAPDKVLALAMDTMNGAKTSIPYQNRRSKDNTQVSAFLG